MSTQQQIDDPGQWRVGDMFEGECDGHPFSGPIWVDEVGQMLVGATYVRGRDGVIESDVTGHVTRTVEPIPEPTVPWALVRFADGEIAARIDGSRDKWFSRTLGWESWETYVRAYGAPVAVSLPHWSDEVDGLRARVAHEIADEIRRNCTPSAEAYERGGDFLIAAVANWIENPPEFVVRNRALLAEGGAA